MANLTQNERLVQELERTNQELQQFAYIISHDLKAPLRGISSLVQWIGEDYADAFDEDGQEQLHLLKDRVQRMDQLIDGVLHYSRIGRIHEQIQTVNLHKLATEVIDLLAPPDHITIQISARLPVVACQKVRMHQLFQNLLSNAIKFMDKPQGRIVLACRADRHRYHVTVEDNGPGIEEKNFTKIFQIFQTLHGGDTSESTGIGLTLVKKIVELHGGTIHVASRLGEGTTFTFTLPKAPLPASLNP